MANHLERHLLEPSTRSIEVNTDSIRVHTAEKATNPEPLIILSPDELIEFSDGLTITLFDKSLRIFVHTLNTNIVMSKPNLETPPLIQPHRLDYSRCNPRAARPTKPSYHTLNMRMGNSFRCVAENPLDHSCLCQRPRGISSEKKSSTCLNVSDQRTHENLVCFCEL